MMGVRTGGWSGTWGSGVNREDSTYSASEQVQTTAGGWGEQSVTDVINDLRKMSKSGRDFVHAFLELGQTRATTGAEPQEAATMAGQAATQTLGEALRIAQDEVRGHIAVDPRVVHGAPVVAGTRIPVSMILGLLEEGCSIAEVREVYPSLSDEQIRAAVRFAAALCEGPM
jgi:uncharacterized protein (DUF433 family)